MIVNLSRVASLADLRRFPFPELPLPGPPREKQYSETSALAAALGSDLLAPALVIGRWRCNV